MQEVGDRVLVSGCVGKVFSSTSLEITFQDYLIGTLLKKLQL